MVCILLKFFYRVVESVNNIIGKNNDCWLCIMRVFEE